MTPENENMTLAEIVIKESREMEEKRREEQFKKILNAFRQSIKNGNGYGLAWYQIMYDEVRTRLEKEGFLVKVMTASSEGNAAYYITFNENSDIENNIRCID